MTLQRHHSRSKDLRDYVAAQSGDTCIVSFSCGKDSIVSAVACRPHFKRMVMFYLYLVPDLEFVEASLRYYEDRLQTEIIRVPHPSLYRMLHHMVYQPPERTAIIDKAMQSGNLDTLDYQGIEDWVRWSSGAENAFVAIGTRTADSPIRLANVRQHGSLNPTRRSFLPVYDWKIADVVECLTKENIKLPIDYKVFGRSFDGIDARFLGPIKEHFPRDYDRILDWFPLADLDLFRRDARHGPRSARLGACWAPW